ncbi:MAG: tetratricopeptide repeat protein [bacterium]|nr:tetratricopeptide repeat protein [bacterium]
MSNNEEIEEQYIEQEEAPKGPSSASLFVDKIKNWLNGQNKTLVYGILGVLVLVIAGICYQFLYKMPKEERGLTAIYKAQTLFDMDSFYTVAKMAPKLADEFSGTKAGNLAAYMAGTSFLYTGDYKKAIEYLEKVSFSDKVMSTQVIGLLGDAYVENKDLDKGLSQYTKAAKSANTEFTAVWWYKKAARIHEKRDEWKEALTIYNKLKKEYKDAEGNNDIDKFIGRAEAKTAE